MYFWKIDLLKAQLIAKGLTENQTYLYTLAYIVFTTFMVELMRYSPDTVFNEWTHFSSTMNVLIPVAGTMMAFRANGGASGVQFLPRYLSISMVASLRFMVLVIIPLIMTIATLNPESALSGSPFDLLFSACDALLFFFIVKHMREVATARPGADSR
ncbi:hypothetical protein H8L32_22985 [Undibacterium sp. CY18W]|uniref:Uncharacterized protein n=1 Tax=Undibacterium hunanense TaxID=2762292 RepID=A0ABR6ZWV6_9BURK|nr:hypothetical protein [Undibacterium hunanense]MBC3920347.1 hypothetical protein [Undibacterium hunanense]